MRISISGLRLDPRYISRVRGHVLSLSILLFTTMRMVYSNFTGEPSTLQSPPTHAPSLVPRQILFYRKNEPYFGFTNFSRHPVTYNGRLYPTAEHLFQSFKVTEHFLDVDSGM